MRATTTQQNQSDTPLGRSIIDAGLKAGVGRSTIYTAINSGALRARKLGRRTVILDTDLAAWLDAAPSYKVGGQS
jgi:excisionase family DNA binding protein